MSDIRVLIVGTTTAQALRFSQDNQEAIGFDRPPMVAAVDSPANRLRGPEFDLAILLAEPPEDMLQNIEVATRLGDSPKIVRWDPNQAYVAQ